MPESSYVSGSRANRRRAAFTLVELLVVIGIIAVLVGVLLPVLSTARRSSANVKCLSNLRQLAYAFQMYAGANKDAFPVIRQDIPDPASGLPATKNWYWTDQLLPYALPNFKTIFTFTSPEDAQRYMKSVYWCPTWVADRTDLDPYKNPGTDRFRTGYAMNQWPAFKPDFPNPDAMPPSSTCLMRGNGTTGKYWRKSEYADPANRMLLADSNFWFIGFSVLKGATQLAPQNVDINTWFTGSSTAGSMNIDRYRHGKYPRTSGGFYDVKGGQVKFNILFADGHATTATTAEEGYKAIRMRYP